MDIEGSPFIREGRQNDYNDYLDSFCTDYYKPLAETYQEVLPFRETSSRHSRVTCNN